MTEKINYYTELKLDKNASSESLEQDLKACIKEWGNKMNSPNQEERTAAEYMLSIAEEASKVLGDPKNKAEYDKKISTQFEEKMGDYELINNKTDQFINQGNLKEALICAEQLIDINPTDWRGWDAAGRVYRRNHELGLAISHHEKAIELEKNIDRAYNNLGVAQEASGKYVEAFENYQRSLEINPGNDTSLRNCTIALTHMKIDSVYPFFEELQKKRSDTLAYEILAEAYRLKAERLVQTTDGYLSFNSEEQEIEYSALVKKAEELNDKIEYESTYKKALEFKEAGNLNETKILAKQLIDMKPNDWRGWEIAGRSYHDANNKEFAENYYEKAIELEKHVPAYVYCNLGIAQKVLGKHVEAYRNFQRSLEISPNFDRSLEECYKLLIYMDIDSVLPFLDSLKEIRNDKLIFKTLAKAYTLKADEIIEEIDGTPCFTSEEQIQEYVGLLEKAKIYTNLPEIDEKIAEANSMLVKTIDKQKIPVLIIAFLQMLNFIYIVNMFITLLTVVNFVAIAYKAYRPKYEINRLKVGTASFYDELVNKTYIKDRKAATIIIWYMLINIFVFHYIGIPVYSILSIYIIVSSIYTRVIDKKFMNKVNSKDNEGLIFNGELESERRRRIRKIKWSLWWEKWGPTVRKVAKIIGIIALVIIVAYILYWLAIIAIALMVFHSDTREPDYEAEKRALLDEARQKDQMDRERQMRLLLQQEEQQRRYRRRR